MLGGRLPTYEHMKEDCKFDETKFNNRKKKENKYDKDGFDEYMEKCVPLLKLTTSYINIVDTDNNGYFKFSGDDKPNYKFNEEYDLIKYNDDVSNLEKPDNINRQIKEFIDTNIRKSFTITKELNIPIIFFKYTFSDIFNIFIQLYFDMDITQNKKKITSIFILDDTHLFIGLSYKFNLFNLAFNTNTFFQLLLLFAKYIIYEDLYNNIKKIKREVNNDLTKLYNNIQKILINLYDLNIYYGNYNSITIGKLSNDELKILKSYENNEKTTITYKNVIDYLTEQFIFILKVLVKLHEHDKYYYLIFLMSILAYRLATQPPYHLTSLNLLSNNYILEYLKSNIQQIDIISTDILTNEEIKEYVLQRMPILKIYSSCNYEGNSFPDCVETALYNFFRILFWDIDKQYYTKDGYKNKIINGNDITNYSIKDNKLVEKLITILNKEDYNEWIKFIYSIPNITQYFYQKGQYELKSDYNIIILILLYLFIDIDPNIYNNNIINIDNYIITFNIGHAYITKKTSINNTFDSDCFNKKYQFIYYLYYIFTILLNTYNSTLESLILIKLTKLSLLLNNNMWNTIIKKCNIIFFCEKIDKDIFSKWDLHNWYNAIINIKSDIFWGKIDKDIFTKWDTLELWEQAIEKITSDKFWKQVNKDIFSKWTNELWEQAIEKITSDKFWEQVNKDIFSKWTNELWKLAIKKINFNKFWEQIDKDIFSEWKKHNLWSNAINKIKSDKFWEQVEKDIFINWHTSLWVEALNNIRSNIFWGKVNKNIFTKWDNYEWDRAISNIKTESFWKKVNKDVLKKWSIILWILAINNITYKSFWNKIDSNIINTWNIDGLWEDVIIKFKDDESFWNKIDIQTNYALYNHKLSCKIIQNIKFESFWKKIDNKSLKYLINIWTGRCLEKIFTYIHHESFWKNFDKQILTDFNDDLWELAIKNIEYKSFWDKVNKDIFTEWTNELWKLAIENIKSDKFWSKVNNEIFTEWTDELWKLAIEKIKSDKFWSKIDTKILEPDINQLIEQHKSTLKTKNMTCIDGICRRIANVLPFMNKSSAKYKYLKYKLKYFKLKNKLESII